MVGRVSLVGGAMPEKKKSWEPPSASGSEDVRRWREARGQRTGAGGEDQTDRGRWRRGSARKPPDKICSSRLDKTYFIDGLKPA